MQMTLLESCGSIEEMEDTIEQLKEQRDELLEALKLVASLPGFEPEEEYGQTVLEAIAKATSK